MVVPRSGPPDPHIIQAISERASSAINLRRVVAISDVAAITFRFHHSSIDRKVDYDWEERERYERTLWPRKPDWFRRTMEMPVGHGGDLQVPLATCFISVNRSTALNSKNFTHMNPRID